MPTDSGSDNGQVSADAGSAAAITVVIADNHVLVREGLGLIINAQPDIDVIGEAGNIAELTELLASEHPNVLLLDLNLGDESGLVVLPGLRESHPDTAVVILTMQKDPAYARRALEAGAAGYVLKEAAAQDLVRAIRAAAEGGTYLEPGLGAALLARGADETDPLTKRERQILGLLAGGHTNAEVAEQLYLSVRTVESHRARIQEKLGISGRAQLIRWARDHGLVDP